ncbi:MAG TPA: hypothetical protein VEB86_10140 [Chryseosolibacter sp.]|nr:hypothetical protein [Chryseosolibacter sp.]
MKFLRVSQLSFLILAVAGLTGCDNASSIEPADHHYFVKYYGGNGNQTGVDAITKPDGTILLLGNWQSDRDESRIYLVNVDNRGRVLWEKKLGTFQESARDIERTPDGNFVILSQNNSGSNSQVKLWRVTSQGVKIDSVVYGSTGNEDPRSITPLSDGGYVIAGVTEYTDINVNPTDPEDMSDIFHYRCTSTLNFNINWRSQYNSGSVEGGTKVLENSLSSFYVFGFSNAAHAGNLDGNVNLYYYEIGATGTAGADNYFGDFDNDTEPAFVISDQFSGGFFVAGTETTNSGSVNLHVTKFRSPLTFRPADDEVFDRSIPIESRKLTALAATPASAGDTGYLLIANETQDDGTNNIWLTKVDDQTGSVIWSSTFGSEEEDDLGGAVMELPDGRILVVGTIGLVNNQSKMVLMKLNSAGQLMD